MRWQLHHRGMTSKQEKESKFEMSRWSCSFAVANMHNTNQSRCQHCDDALRCQHLQPSINHSILRQSWPNDFLAEKKMLRSQNVQPMCFALCIAHTLFHTHRAIVSEGHSICTCLHEQSPTRLISSETFHMFGAWSFLTVPTEVHC